MSLLRGLTVLCGLTSLVSSAAINIRRPSVSHNEYSHELSSQKRDPESPLTPKVFILSLVWQKLAECTNDTNSAIPMIPVTQD